LTYFRLTFFALCACAPCVHVLRSVCAGIVGMSKPPDRAELGSDDGTASSSDDGSAAPLKKQSPAQAMVVTVEAGTQELSAEQEVNKCSRKEKETNSQEPSTEGVSKQPRMATRSDTHGVRNVSVKNSTTQSRRTAAQKKEAARKARAAAAEAFLHEG